MRRLHKFLETETETSEYELIYDEDLFNIYKFLTVKNIATGEEFEISTIVDGQDSTEKEK